MPTVSSIETAIFLDPTGRRWRRARRALRALAALTVALVAAAAPSNAVGPLEPPGHAQLSAAAVGPAPATVGDGPLVRVVTPDRGRLRDAFTGQVVGRLTSDERSDVGGERYVVQRYGYVPDDRPTLSLTFDDGPDAVWTPRVLDLLSRYSAPATFFVVGAQAARHPEITRRIHREGHLVGNHTSTHADLAQEPAWRQRWELVTADRVIRRTTGAGTAYVRLPYDGGDGADFVEAVMAAQRLGYAVSTYDFDTEDWQHTGDAEGIPLPPLDGRDLTVLLHDSGGDRSATLAHLEQLLPAARAAGYTFTTVETSQPVPAQRVALAQGPSPWDAAATAEVSALFVWPDRVLRALFVVALWSVAGVGLVQLALGVLRKRRLHERASDAPYAEPVDVLIAAYDEEAVIARTLRSVLASTQPLGRVIVVDDGSTDGTAAAVAGVHERDARVQLVRQPNGGKSSALNHALAVSAATVVVTLDADTVVSPSTVGHLVRPFASGDERLGAVAGVVKVGNRTRNLLTRWQALEYLVQIGVERASQDAVGAICIIPGACASWRRSAVLAVGGYSHDTLAEDCDLSLSLQRRGFRVTQDDDAVALTEAPDTVDDLLKQRSRWMFGTMQAVAKHRDLILDRRSGWLGMFVLPSYVLSLLVPLVFLPVVAVMAVALVTREGVGVLLPYTLSFLLVQLVVSAAGVRMLGERWDHLLVVPVYRLVYEPLRAYLLYTSVSTAVKGVALGWNKLQRTGVMDLAPPPALPRGAGALR